MNPAIKTERITEASPRPRARITGTIYLLFFLTAVLGEFFMEQAGMSGFGVSGDATATARTLLAHEASFQVGFALSLISTACYVALIALFYQMFQPVSRSLALLATFFSVMRVKHTALTETKQLGGNS